MDQTFGIDGGHSRTRMSKDVLTVGTLSAPHGKKRHGVNEFLVEGQPYRLPMWLINGVGEGPTLVVTAGVHASRAATRSERVARPPARRNGWRTRRRCSSFITHPSQRSPGKTVPGDNPGVCSAEVPFAGVPLDRTPPHHHWDLRPGPWHDSCSQPSA